MGKDPKKPTREPQFVNDVAVTYGTKPVSYTHLTLPTNSGV